MNCLPKLVRNNIPEMIAKSGKGCKYRVANKEEVKEFLFAKLREETHEFIESPSIEEAADIYEVFLAILDNWNISLSDVIDYSFTKKEERGNFSNNFVLESVDNFEVSGSS